MNVRIKYDNPKNEALRLLIEHGSGTRSGLNRIDKQIRSGEPGTRFVIMDEAGDTLIEGTFWGDDNDRDVPLVSARIMVLGDDVEPVALAYEDGDGFRYAPDVNAVLPEGK